MAGRGRKPPKRTRLTNVLRGISLLRQPHVYLQAAAVHLIEIITVLAAQYILPPVLVVQVPPDGLLNSCIKIIRWLPSQLCFYLGRVNGVAHVMAGTVCHKLNQALRLIKGLQNGLYHFQVGALIMPSDVIHLSLIHI